ncbi:MAG TPA: ATP-binding protein [Patescibacteria group bacterium]|nr:ATP-binding protein [Patescibacteria group bacterium]
MRLRLKTKFTLTTALLVLTVVAVVSVISVAALMRQTFRHLDDRAHYVAKLVLDEARSALDDAAARGQGPTSEKDADVDAFVRGVLQKDPRLAAALAAAVGYSPTIYEVSIVDRDSVALVSSDPNLVGHLRLPRARLENLAQFDFLEQIHTLYGPSQIYEVSLPFNLGSRPFGEIRVALNSALLRNEISPTLRTATEFALFGVFFSAGLAFLISNITLAPLQKITAQLDRIASGQFDAQPLRSGDELGQVSTKISEIGQQLRGVRAIFSGLRENLSALTAGMDDAVLVFSATGQAVLATPAVEKFLGCKPQELIGRDAGQMFPADQPLGKALGLADGRLHAVDQVEVALNGGSGPQRVRASVREIAEGGSQMGALVTLRDLDSLDRLDSELEVSERMAALARVTAGVAHEVKNPLNSMRLWLENLRESLPSDPEAARSAVKVLDSEIDRLDRVVKRFLDFTKPVELHLEDTDLAELVREVLALARPQIERAGVKAAVEQPNPLPAVHVDRALLQQALMNLVLNACQAMPQGGRLDITLRRKADAAEIRIADTGHGIAPEHRRRIFELFFTTRPSGSGLGLATAFRIVQLHNGSIDFESEPGRGTTFILEFPLAR